MNESTIRDRETCPNCATDMTVLGCCIVMGMPFFWCANCGTIKPCDHAATSPAITRKGAAQ